MLAFIHSPATLWSTSPKLQMEPTHTTQNFVFKDSAPHSICKGWLGSNLPPLGSPHKLAGKLLVGLRANPWPSSGPCSSTSTMGTDFPAAPPYWLLIQCCHVPVSWFPLDPFLFRIPPQREPKGVITSPWLLLFGLDEPLRGIALLPNQPESCLWPVMESPAKTLSPGPFPKPNPEGVDMEE